ncbi:co-chaperone GroES [Amygdalobacter nucleatus]|uniref:Co-chaperonin GroES n=1 Tax=Amygdalobacter nucleatus TaxID=3029274 RepID=A0A133YGU4_9FIRM|nr:co-chaperone GroES [Amygdalobacter nucleatus]KXB42414.1 chaperonin GroS [Amygdalobacter nucleatus]MDF0485989.1 co-chaperone GroES [Amygdalobacter nucleatus]WEG37454.1 co-chaperone GroES [Amygdalobacter nucleatus]
MNIKPLADRVVIKMIEKETKNEFGLFLPDSAKEKPQVAEVVAVGPGTKDVKMELKVGDQVICSKYAGTEVKLNDVTYSILKQSDVLAIVE